MWVCMQRPHMNSRAPLLSTLFCSLTLSWTWLSLSPWDPPVSTSQCWNYKHTLPRFLKHGRWQVWPQFFMLVWQILCPLKPRPSHPSSLPILRDVVSVTHADKHISNWTIRNLTTLTFQTVWLLTRWCLYLPQWSLSDFELLNQDLSARKPNTNTTDISCAKYFR